MVDNGIKDMYVLNKNFELDSLLLSCVGVPGVHVHVHAHYM